MDCGRWLCLQSLIFVGLLLISPPMLAAQPLLVAERSNEEIIEEIIKNAQESEETSKDSAEHQPVNKADNVVGDTNIGKSVEWLVGTRDLLSKNISEMAENMDRFFAGEAAEQLVNGSYIRLSLSQRFDRGGKLTSKQKLKLKLDLPYTESRLKLVFETDPQDTDSLLDKNRDSIPTEDVRLGDDSGLSGAFQFLLSERYKWRTSLDAGLRTPLPLDPFIRLRFRRTHRINEQWQMRIRQKFYYFDDDGFGERTQLFFERPITDSYFFRAKSEAQFSDQENRFEFAEVISTFHILDDEHVIDYSVGVLGESQPVPRTSAYFIQTTLRKKLYRNWLYVSFTPDFYFQREENFSLTTSFTLRLDLIFSEE